MKISRVMGEIYGRKRAPLSRGDDERTFLREWLGREDPVKKIPSKDSAPLTLSESIESCSRCRNISGKTLPRGSGEKGVMILLNPPGLISGEEKKVYESRSDELLGKIITSMGLEYEDCYITSLIKCETSDLLQKPSHMLGECMDIFLRELREVRPGIVIVMGDMLPLRKHVQGNPGISWFNIHHPIILIKNSELKRPAWNTLKLVIEKLKETETSSAGGDEFSGR